MKRYRYCLSVLVLLLSSQTLMASTVTFKIKSLYPYIVSLSFYSQNRNHSWPGGDKVWILDDSRTHTYRLSCQYGEKICYGAWPRGNSDSYWGTGNGDEHSCSHCCLKCDGGVGQTNVLRPWECRTYKYLNPLKNQNCRHIVNATKEYSTHEVGVRGSDC